MIKKIVILKPKKSLNFSESINAGINNSHNEKVFIANDDIIISKRTIERLADKCDENTITGPDSNCNYGWLTSKTYKARDINLVPAMLLEQVQDYIDPYIYDISPLVNPDKLTKELDWLAFFATMIHRKCFDDVGLLDENFVYDREDLNWCIRAKEKGKKFLYCWDSYCFHFGGVSRKRKHQELGLKHEEDTIINEQYYNAIHGVRKIKKIEDFEEYTVSEDGIVISHREWRGTAQRMITPVPNEDGYLKIGLFKNKKTYTKLAHRLVAETFIPNPENKETINHKNGNKKDNRVENLEWATRSENIQHTFDTGLANHKGEKNSNSKLTEIEVEKIREEYSLGGISQKNLGNKYNISESMVGNIVRNENWAKKPIIGFYCHDAFEYWDERSILSSIQDDKPSGIGGSETQVILLSREFSKLGYKVKIFNKCKENHKDSGGFDVEYIFFQNFEEYSKKITYDYFIASRYLDCFDVPFNSKRNFAMIHDVHLIMGQRDPKDVKLDKIEKYFCLSNSHKEYVSSHHGIPMDKLVITSNGLDFNRFQPKKFKRDPYKLIYSSSPDRGLEVLLDLIPKVKEQVPEVTLDIYYGFENFRDQQYIEKMMNKINSLDGVKYYGRVGQDELARRFTQSTIWAYPSGFTETFCCLPGTMIKTIEGRKNIEEINIGDIVETHKGRYRKVYETLHRYVEEVSLSINTAYLKDDLKVTKEHPVLALKRKDITCTRRSNTFCKRTSERCKPGFNYYNKNGKKYYSKNECENLKERHIPEWMPSSDLEKGDFLVYPINKKFKEPLNFSSYCRDSSIKKGYVFNPKTKANKIRDFKLTEDFMELCGWFVSEGHFDGVSSISFSLNILEEKESNFITEQLKNLGLNYRIEKIDHENTLKIVTNSVILGRFFTNNFGHLAKNKGIPNWIKDLDLKYLERFLKGVIKGDGSQSHNCMTYECASEKLVLDLFDSLLKFNCVSSISNTFKNKILKKEGKIVRLSDEFLPAWHLSCSMNQNSNFFKSIEYIFDLKNTNNNHYIIEDGYVYLPIRSIKKNKYAGKVYNLEVEEDNSYIANNVVVHNCITALEAMAGGAVVLSSEFWGLIDTVKDGGILLPMHNNRNTVHTAEYQDKYVEECVRLMANNSYREHWQKKGYDRCARFTWMAVASQWDHFWKTGEWIEIQ